MRADSIDIKGEARSSFGLIIEIPRGIFDSMIAHAEREFPLECCGLLGSRCDAIDSIYPLRNEDQSRVRYTADRRDLIVAVRAIRERRGEIGAIYHSHPSTPPIPSRVDLAENYYGDTPRIIVSLAEGRVEVRAWRLGLDRFDEIEVIIGQGLSTSGSVVELSSGM